MDAELEFCDNFVSWTRMPMYVWVGDDLYFFCCGILQKFESHFGVTHGDCGGCGREYIVGEDIEKVEEE